MALDGQALSQGAWNTAITARTGPVPRAAGNPLAPPWSGLPTVRRALNNRAPSRLIYAASTGDWGSPVRGALSRVLWRSRQLSGRALGQLVGYWRPEYEVGIDRAGAGWWAGRMAGPVAFVGREGELSRLLGALGGGARVVLMTGDAGVGKTRFAGEAMSRAAAAGMVMARGSACRWPAHCRCCRSPSRWVSWPGWRTARCWRRRWMRLRVTCGLRWADWARAGRPARAAAQAGVVAGAAVFGSAWLLDAVARKSAVGLVIEDVQWADNATLDLLTFLGRAGRRDAVTVVVTCRGDEAPLSAHVAGWLAQVRGAAGVEEIVLGPLSRLETAGQVCALAGGPVPGRVVDELYARARPAPSASPFRCKTRPTTRRPRR
jgi:hypothetical protein